MRGFFKATHLDSDSALAKVLVADAFDRSRSVLLAISESGQLKLTTLSGVIQCQVPDEVALRALSELDRVASLGPPDEVETTWDIMDGCKVTGGVRTRQGQWIDTQENFAQPGDRLIQLCELLAGVVESSVQGADREVRDLTSWLRHSLTEVRAHGSR